MFVQLVLNNYFYQTCLNKCYPAWASHCLTLLCILYAESHKVFWLSCVVGDDERDTDLFLCDTNTCKFDGECLRIGDIITCICNFKVRPLSLSLFHQSRMCCVTKIIYCSINSCKYSECTVYHNICILLEMQMKRNSKKNLCR